MKRVYLILAMTLALASCTQALDDKKTATSDRSTVIDVRTEGEYAGGHLKDAINIPHTRIRMAIKDHVRDKGQKIILYCHSGMRARIAQEILEDMGYSNVINAGSYASLKRKEKKIEESK